MTSDNSLRGTILAAIEEWSSANGGGFPTAFVIALDYVDASGENALAISQMNDQTAQRSLGLVTYLDEWYRADARNLWHALWGEQ